MILSGLAVALFGVLCLVAWAMQRLRRAQVLRLLALITHRQLPLEGTLAVLARSRTGAREERLLRRLMVNITRGADLPLALSLTGIVTPQQAVALQIAEKRGAANRLLERMAEHVTQMEQRLAATELSLVYPLILGVGLIAHILFVNMFIVPKIAQMYVELGVTPEYESVLQLGCYLPCAMLLWGLLALSLQSQTCGDAFWRYVPWVRDHFRTAEQAALARNLGLALSTGATLEEALDAMAVADAGGAFRRAIQHVNGALKRGEETLAAFRTTTWRPEFMWAIESVTHGVAPGPCLDLVATVLEGKAKARLDKIHRFCMPLATLITAIGIGLVAVGIFEALYGLAQGLMT